MAQVLLTSVHGNISFSEALSSDQVNAWSYSTFAAQAAARSLSPETTSDLYFNEMTSRMGTYGWQLLNQGNLDLELDTRHPPSLGDVVQRGLAAVQSVDPSELQLLQRILNAFRTPSLALLRFATSWWSKVQVHADQAEFAMGPLRLVNGRPDTVLVYYSYTFDLSSLGHGGLAISPLMFHLPLPDVAYTLNARHLHLQLDMGAYDKIKESLVASVREQVSSHVDSVALDI